MTLENQVVSLELAKKLKKLGVKQESLFWWNELFEMSVTKYILNYGRFNRVEAFSAFTVAELGEMLPAFIKHDKRHFKLYVAKNENDEWFIEYQGWTSQLLENYELLVQRNAATEADARAKMLIYLLENKLIAHAPPEQTT